ncbi:hypothetical protein ABT121_42125 [Streptomyces sp. NPDC001928]|uniref:hypothetical protein n=1 Tax=Streptomyces sp. NPDC001928 TaxID=3154404 RepID=UPI003319D870
MTSPKPQTNDVVRKVLASIRSQFADFLIELESSDRAPRLLGQWIDQEAAIVISSGRIAILPVQDGDVIDEQPDDDASHGFYM